MPKSEKRKGKTPISLERSPFLQPSPKNTKIASLKTSSETHQRLLIINDNSPHFISTSLEESFDLSSKKKYADLTKTLMATNSRESLKEDSDTKLHAHETKTPNPTNSPLFSIDNIPSSQWRKIFLDLKAWLDAKMVDISAIQYKICAHMTGILKEWYVSFGTVNQESLHKASIN